MSKPKKLTTEDVFKQFTVGRKLTYVCTCTGDSEFRGMDKGETYTESLTVVKVKRIRRQWEEPGKEVVFKAKGDKIKHDGTIVSITGYTFLKSTDLNDANITEIPNGFQIVYNKRNAFIYDPKVINAYTFES